MTTFAPQFMTVVYRINRPEEFLAENERLHSHFYPDPSGKPWAVTAMSMDHEIHRLELIEEAAEEDRLDLLDGILSHPKIGAISCIDDINTHYSSTLKITHQRS